MKLRSLTLALLLALLISIGSVYGTDYSAGSNTAVDEVSIHGFAGCELVFSKDDFLAVLEANASDLRGIVIMRTPDEGVLTFSGRQILPGEAVTTQTLDTLHYKPATQDAMETTFQFIPVYARANIGQTITVTLKLSHKENLPPTAEDVEIKTYRDIAVGGRFSAVDPEGDAVSYRICSKAKRGEVEISGEGVFTYTPFHKKTGSDSFKYVAVDAYGNTSEEATVRVRIDKPSTKESYADMSGHTAAYAALRLLEEDIYKGETVCGVSYFQPDETVSRGEFIAMTIRMMDLDSGLTPTVHTGFADDEVLSPWFKPYAVAALEAGIMNGHQGEDGRIFANADSDITLSEASVILNNALEIDNPLAVSSLPITTPVWAATAISNLDSCNILPVNAMDYSAPLTRGDIAVMLCSAMEIRAASEKGSGLLSWVFGVN